MITKTFITNIYFVMCPKHNDIKLGRPVVSVSENFFPTSHRLAPTDLGQVLQGAGAILVPVSGLLVDIPGQEECTQGTVLLLTSLAHLNGPQVSRTKLCASIPISLPPPRASDL